MKYFQTSVKVLAVILLLGTLNVTALECKAAKNTEKKECQFKDAICKAWTNVSTAVKTKKKEIFTAAQEMKARGWNQWTNKEKAGVVVGGTLVAATAAYLVYKVYKSFTTPKVKGSIRSSRV